MSANLKDPFSESCCDSVSFPSNKRSAQVCGCDEAAGWICRMHQDKADEAWIKYTGDLPPLDNILHQEIERPTNPMIDYVDDYQEFVKAQAKIPLDNLPYSFIGLGGEVGECLEWYKKSVYRGDASFDDKELKKELGDVLFYLTRITLAKGWSLKKIMKANRKKLEKRYAKQLP